MHKPLLHSDLSVSSSLPCPGDVAERAAIAELDRPAALKEAGVASHETFVAAHRERLAQIFRNVPYSIDRSSQRLAAVSLSFLDTPHFSACVEHGWTDLELFGVAPFAFTVRLAEQGLVSGLALSKLNTPKLIEVLADRAVIRCRSGSLLTHHRFAGRLEEAIPWWELSHFSQPNDFAYAS